MKLKNKKSGEIVDLTEGFIRDTYNGSMIQIKPIAISNKEGYVYDSLAELNKEWEDYEEPKEHWFISEFGNVYSLEHIPMDKERTELVKEIGNYFETKEEAEQTVEKLKAWKRLKDANIDYKLSREYDDFTETIHANVSFSFNSYPLVGKDLDLIFGGEE